MIKNKMHNNLLSTMLGSLLTLKKQQCIMLVLCLLITTKVLASDTSISFYVEGDFQPYRTAYIPLGNESIDKQAHLYVESNIIGYDLGQLIKNQTIKLFKNKGSSKAVFTTKINVESIQISTKLNQKKKYQYPIVYKAKGKSLPLNRSTLLKHRFVVASTIYVKTKLKLFGLVSVSQTNLVPKLYTYITSCHDAVFVYEKTYNKTHALQTFFNHLYPIPIPTNFSIRNLFYGCVNYVLQY